MDKNKETVPLFARDPDYYRLQFTNGLPPGTDSIEQLHEKPRLPRPPPEAKRTLPPLPPHSERNGKWLEKYLNTLDPETEYDQIIRAYTFYKGSDFNTAIGYAAVFIWLTSTPAGAKAIHGGRVTTRGHQRYYETQLFNLHWVTYGSSSEETKRYIDQINKLHASIWRRVPGSFSFAWEAQAAILLLSWYESYIRREVGAKQSVPSVVKRAWPEWGERVTGHFRSEPLNDSTSFGINYPRTFEEIEEFTEWFQSFSWDEQRTEEDRIKGRETAESFIHQFNELWFPRPLHFLGRTVLLTFVPPRIRRKQFLEDPNPLLERAIKFFFKTMINFGDKQPDPKDAPLEELYENIQRWDLNKMDAEEGKRRTTQDRWFMMVGLFGVCLLLFALLQLRAVLPLT